MMLVTILAYAIACMAQDDVTKFLGIPVDGTKSEMTQKLKAKGFKANAYDKDVLEGQFNGGSVNVYIVTNRDKVCRIMVCDKISVDESSIKIRFNNLVRQFMKNANYIHLDDHSIPADENISIQMLSKNKRYEAVFYQKSEFYKAMEAQDSVAMSKYTDQLVNYLKSNIKYTDEQLSNPTPEMQEEYIQLLYRFALESNENKPVWFMISKDGYSEYYITMYYDNELNQANGEDL